MKPVVIYISGAPGAGKSTLAKLLSDQLYIPFVSSDMIHGGLEFTEPDHDRNSAIRTVFVPLLVHYAKNDVSFIVDHVLQKDIAQSTIIDMLRKYANVIYIHVQTDDPIRRYVERIKTSAQPDIIRRRKLLLKRAVHHIGNLQNTANVIDLDIPTLVVDTKNGYDPALNDIISFINKAREGKV